MLMSLREYAAGQLAGHDEVAATRERHTATSPAARRDGSRRSAPTPRSRPGRRCSASARTCVRRSSTVRAGRARTRRCGSRARCAGTPSRTDGSRRPSHSSGSSTRRCGRRAIRRRPVGGAARLRRARRRAGRPRRRRGRLSRLSVARGPEDQRRYAVAQAFLGHVARDADRSTLAAGHYARTREIYGGLGNRRGVAWAAHDSACSRSNRASWPAPRRCCATPCSSSSPSSTSGRSRSARGRSRPRDRRGELDAAGGMLDRALALHGDVGNRRGLAQCLEAVAEVALARRAPAAAARLLRRRRARAGAVRPTEAEPRRRAERAAVLAQPSVPTQADHEHRPGGRCRGGGPRAGRPGRRAGGRARDAAVG